MGGMGVGLLDILSEAAVRQQDFYHCITMSDAHLLLEAFRVEGSVVRRWYEGSTFLGDRREGEFLVG
jgi:hypothetical protein